MRKFNKPIHLTEDFLEKKLGKCPICLSEKRKKIGIIQKSPLINAYLCKTCHLGYAERQPTQMFLDDYYSTFYDTTDRKTTIYKDLLVNHLKENINVVDRNEQFNFLDFGGGDGSISYGLAKYILEFNETMKIKILVIDPNFRKPKDSNGKINIYSLSSIESIPQNTEFDFVIASAILEHIKDPRKVLEKLLYVLKPSGIFYARTPYLFPFKSLFNKIGINLDMRYPGHLFDMGSKFWNSILPTLNLESSFHIIKSRPSLIQTSIRENIFKWIVLYLFKFPNRFFNKYYHLVGGWEILIKKKIM